MKQEEKTIAKNRRAFHEYEVLDRYEAGIELTGTEVRSLRENNCQMTDSFILIRNGEAWAYNIHIPPFGHGNINNPDPDRKRRLLLHKRQLRELDAAMREKGMAVIALKMYFSPQSLVKLEIAIARGKKLYDKRESMAKRDTQRDIERSLKERGRQA
ncbi:MAG: SsrA-binding protein SmpB [Coriobacteriaceae bacterium]|jgi:SsrA-binding protein|nr:SsrA-binding protein SmpB [Coriobacteriaceae bacterium]